MRNTLKKGEPINFAHRIHLVLFLKTLNINPTVIDCLFDSQSQNYLFGKCFCWLSNYVEQTSNIVFILHGNLRQKRLFELFTASRFPYVMLYAHSMTVQREGVHLLVKLEKLKHSSTESAAAKESYLKT